MFGIRKTLALVKNAVQDIIWAKMCAYYLLMSRIAQNIKLIKLIGAWNVIIIYFYIWTHLYSNFVLNQSTSVMFIDTYLQMMIVLFAPTAPMAIILTLLKAVLKELSTIAGSMSKFHNKMSARNILIPFHF